MHDFDQLRLRIARAVAAIAVGRLDEDVVGVGHRRRIAQDRCAGPAEVAGANDDPFLAALVILAIAAALVFAIARYA